MPVTIANSALREIDLILNDARDIHPGRYRRYRLALEEADAALAYLRRLKEAADEAPVLAHSEVSQPESQPVAEVSQPETAPVVVEPEAVKPQTPPADSRQITQGKQTPQGARVTGQQKGSR